MSSIIRKYNKSNNIRTIINLLHIPRITLNDNKIIFDKTNETEISLDYQNKERAKEEFEDICKTLDNYFEKSQLKRE